MNLKIKETELIASEGFFRAQISFTQGEEFEMSGFEDVEHAYNRDFFSYNRYGQLIILSREHQETSGDLLFF